MATVTVGQPVAERHSSNQALLWLLGFFVIIALGVAFSTMRNSSVYTLTGDTKGVPAELAPAETDKTVPALPMDSE